MKTNTFLAFLAGVTATYAAAVTARANPLDDVYIVVHYPSGLPEGLYPGTDPKPLKPRAAQRVDVVNPIVIEAPDIGAPREVGVFACNEINFRGNCVFVRSARGQCVSPPVNLINASDVTSSVGPDRPWRCQFYAAFDCDPSEGVFDLEFPGISDLSVTDFDERISSYRCS